ncbi:hypothetical protein VE02_09044 [Pseudogymnoascus sp. 03VT05]|nr:hypothetical protein VE02_09044 [Pseudogymnoascus sp. 03VT05]
MTGKHPVEFDKYFNVVAGELRDSKTKSHGIDPSTKSELWPVPVATDKDVEDAVAAANKAFVTWSETPFEERHKMIKEYQRAYELYLDEFTDVLMKEAGKPRVTASGESEDALNQFEHNLKLKLPEEVLDEPDRIITTRHVPLGVVAAICPWNFPIVLSLGKILPAILAGCCIIIKPSPFTPYTALKLAEIAQQIFPPGVVQALGGDDALGPTLVAHPKIQKVTFTGSTATGKRIFAASAPTMKRVVLELGGNDATIIFPDVNVGEVAPQVALGALFHTGQVCVAVKRIYVHEDVYDQFLEAIVQAVGKMSMDGDEVEAPWTLGPIQNMMQYEKLKELLKEIEAKGLKLALGSGAVEESEGYFIKPVVVDNPPEDSRIVTEEQFGPILPILKWKNVEDVINRANNTKMGLAACVWSADTAAAEKVGRKLQAGSVFINATALTTPKAMLSGHKESGLGGEWGSTGLLSYCNVQVMHEFKLV